MAFSPVNAAGNEIVLSGSKCGRPQIEDVRYSTTVHNLILIYDACYVTYIPHCAAPASVADGRKKGIDLIAHHPCGPKARSQLLLLLLRTATRIYYDLLYTTTRCAVHCRMMVYN